MKIFKEDVFDEINFHKNGELDYRNISIDDALVKSIDKCFYDMRSLLVDEKKIVLTLQVNAEITYLDAKDLSELKLDIEFSEDIPFSFDKEEATELDIDFFDDELDAGLLIYDLIMLNVPFNYSEKKNANVLKEESFYDNQNQPFAKIFEKKE